MKLLTLMIIFLSGPLMAAQNCSPAEVQALVGKNDIINCQTYQQTDGRNYAVVLDLMKIDESETQARVRHYRKNSATGAFEILFSVDEGIGEYFIDLSTSEGKKSAIILDVNGDGILEIVFRTYTAPSTSVYFHHFKAKDVKITNLGMLETGFGEAEFYPYIVADYDDSVFLEKKKVKIVSEKNTVEYLWKEKAFILKK